MDVVRNYFDRVGRDPASRIKFGLTAVLGFTAFLVACVELGKAGEGGTLVRKFDSRVESHAEAGTHMLVATVCPMPFNCPDWCTDDKNDKGPKKYYCKCVDNKSTMEWKFAPNNKGDHMCQFIEEATPGHKAPKMHPVAVHKAADKVPVTLWDGYALEQEHCQQVNWVMNETQRSRDQFIVCSFHSNLHPDDEPYPTALLDMKVSLQFHKNPKGPWKIPSYEKKFTDMATGVINAGQAWLHLPGWHFISYDIEIDLFKTKKHDFWMHKPRPRFEHMMFDSRLALNRSTWDNPPAFSLAYSYDNFEVVREWEEETMYSSRRALGVAGGIAFLLSLLNVALFACATAAFSLNTSEVEGTPYEYTYNTSADVDTPGPPVSQPAGDAEGGYKVTGGSGGGYGSIA